MHLRKTVYVFIAFMTLIVILCFDGISASEMLIASGAAIVQIVVIADGSEPKPGFTVAAPIISAAWSFNALIAFGHEWQAFVVTLGICTIVYHLAAWADVRRPPFINGHPVCRTCKTRLHYRSFVPYIAWLHQQCSACDSTRVAENPNCGVGSPEDKGEQSGEPELPITRVLKS